MTAEDLGHEAAELVSLSHGEAKSLSKLAELAVRQVPGCAAAHATIWRDGELTAVAATWLASQPIAPLASALKFTKSALVVCWLCWSKPTS